jgi:predicted SAM-dependent methyltransferase
LPRWFQSVEVLPEAPPFSAELMAGLGARGIHMGSARNLHPGWLNTDQIRISEREGRSTEPGKLALVEGAIPYLQLDSTTGYPFADETFEWAYSEHFVEHLTLDEAIRWLAEVRRILKPGGLLRVSTPDLERYLRAYVDPADPFFADRRERMRHQRAFGGAEVPDRGAWMINYLFYSYGHAWIYDSEELRHVIEGAGFDPGSVTKRSYRESAVPDVGLLDLEDRGYQSLYVEARR